MDSEAFIPNEIERLKALWSKGDFAALHEAFLWCGLNKQPLPDWVVNGVDAQLTSAFEKLGSPGKGKTGGYKAVAQRQAVHEKRWGLARFYIGNRAVFIGPRATLDDAYEETSSALRGTIAQGSAASVKKSYEKIQRERKRQPN